MTLLILLLGSLPAAALPPVRTVFIVVFENRLWADFKGNPNAPYLNKVLLPRASYCEQYFNPPGMHPSLPNYLWLEAGSNLGITDGAAPAINHRSTTNHLSTLLHAAGISWRTYQEDIDGGCIPLSDTNGYAVRHNPFAYFDDVTGTNSPDYAYGLQHIRPFGELAADLANNTVARYNFITPNLCHDGHDLCAPLYNGAAQIDSWLSANLPAILASPAYSNNGALFLTFDEGTGGADGPIGMLLLSPLARGGGYSNSLHYTHSSTVRTLQEIFQVFPLLNDATNALGLDDLFAPFEISRIETVDTSSLRLTITGTYPSATNLLQSSTNLTDWTPVRTNVADSYQWPVVLPAAPAAASQFFRAVLLP